MLLKNLPFDFNISPNVCVAFAVTLHKAKLLNNLAPILYTAFAAIHLTNIWPIVLQFEELWKLREPNVTFIK